MESMNRYFYEKPDYPGGSPVSLMPEATRFEYQESLKGSIL